MDKWNINDLDDKQLSIELVKAWKETTYAESLMVEAIARILNKKGGDD